MEDIYDGKEVNSISKTIEAMYLAEVVFGQYTPKESFFASSDNGKEYFADKFLVAKNIEEFKSLSKRKNRFWVLVEDQIWGGKWNDKEVSRIVAISSNRASCLTHKRRLSMRMKVMMDLIDTQEAHIKLIENRFNNVDFELNESECLDRKDLLQLQLELLNKKLSGD